MDATDLRAAYDEFLAAAAEAQGVEPAASDEHGWTVAMVVAHVTGNDALVAAHLRGIADGSADYDNAPVIDERALRSIATSTSLGTLLVQATDSAAEVVELVAALDEQLGEHPFPTKIVDGGEVRVDGPLPVTAFLGAQARVHLPMHTEQIRAIDAR